MKDIIPFDIDRADKGEPILYCGEEAEFIGFSPDGKRIAVWIKQHPSAPTWGVKTVLASQINTCLHMAPKEIEVKLWRGAPFYQKNEQVIATVKGQPEHETGYEYCRCLAAVVKVPIP